MSTRFQGSGTGATGSGRIRWGHRALVFAFLLGMAALPLHGQIPKPVIGSSSIPAPPPEQKPGVMVPSFAFHSGFWVNLQHFLYWQARRQRGLMASGGAAPGAAEDRTDLSALTPSERQTWQKAVDFYAENFADQDFHYNGFLVRIDDRLSDMGTCPDLSGRSSPACESGIDPATAAILEEAAPVYRAHWWAAQNQANQAWISRVGALVRQYGNRPARQLAVAFGELWPPDPIPIDVVAYAGPFGAYVTLGPPHVVLAGGNPLNQGLDSLEVVFREASHVLAQPVETEIIKQCRQQTKPVPRDLWHAITTYTTAGIFEQDFAGRSGPAGAGPESFSGSNRAYIAARGWQNYQQILKLYWQPYLNNRTDLQSAVADMINAL